MGHGQTESDFSGFGGPFHFTHIVHRARNRQDVQHRVAHGIVLPDVTHPNEPPERKNRFIETRTSIRSVRAKSVEAVPSIFDKTSMPINGITNLNLPNGHKIVFKYINNKFRDCPMPGPRLWPSRPTVAGAGAI